MINIFDTTNTAASYLAALVDGEGCIGTYSWIGKSGALAHHRIVTISVKDKEIIDAAERCYRILGIPFNRHTRPPKERPYPMYCIGVHSYNGIKKFFELIPIQHKGKIKRIKQALDSFLPQLCSSCKCPWDTRTPGCKTCQGRHKYRRRSEEKGSAQKASAPGKTGRPRKGRISTLDNNIQKILVFVKRRPGEERK